jgi:uncharacterized protein YggU (UPF0235/DUF167 family)
VEGAANAALMRVLGRALRLPPSAIRITRGTSGRDKVVLLVGTEVSGVRALLEGPDEEDGS